MNPVCYEHLTTRNIHISEYIIFRGTDICDLNVCDLPNDRFPQDPAILSATTQPPAPIGQPGYGVQGQNVSLVCQKYPIQLIILVSSICPITKVSTRSTRIRCC